ncbi:MAG: ExeA family protein [Syntrophobacteraceae bacterium]
MYLSHFGLQKTPFDSSPDPSVFYPSGTHREAQSTLLSCIESRVGLMWLAGRSGLGKTTLLHSLIERLDPENVRVVLIANPDLSYRGLLEVIYRALGVELPASPGLIDLGHHLYQALQREYDQGRNVVLMIDDVQKMPVRTLACIQQFQNLEKDGRKLIQVILAGREPELTNILKLGRLAQLKLKVLHRATIVPLSRDESMEYVRFRVTAVAGVKKLPFTQTALKQIVDHCNGNPRHLNLFCERALEAGWRREENPVGATTVKDVVAGLLSIEADSPKTMPRSSVGIAVVLMAALWLITLGLTFFREGRPVVGKPENGMSISSPNPNLVTGHDPSSSGAGASRARGVERAGQSSPDVRRTTNLMGNPTRPPAADPPRIDRLPGGSGSEVFWVYGPRDLPRPEGARTRGLNRLATGEEGGAPDHAS